MVLVEWRSEGESREREDRRLYEWRGMENTTKMKGNVWREGKRKEERGKKYETAVPIPFPCIPAASSVALVF